MSDQRKRTGDHGEHIACGYLQEAGLTILARNWRRAGGELDIVAAEGETLVFIEVRTRSSRSYGRAEESVDWRKQRQVRKVAALFLAAEQVRYRQFRFDVVVVELAGPAGRVLDIRHLRNAF
jgi:putative endonuclease